MGASYMSKTTNTPLRNLSVLLDSMMTLWRHIGDGALSTTGATKPAGLSMLIILIPLHQVSHIVDISLNPEPC